MRMGTVIRMADAKAAAFRPSGNGGDRLLALLQLTNASFPTGAFTHSYGFETWIAADAIADVAEAERRCRDWLRFGVATGDAVAVVHAYRAALEGDVARLAELDALCGALKLGRETREASSMTGKALLAACRDIFELEGMRRFGAMMGEGACEGHHAVIYGVAGAGLALGETETVTSYLWSALSNLVAVNQRLVPLGQVDAQRIVAAAGPLIDSCAEIARHRPLGAMCSTYAALDVAAMRHERLGSRLCIS
jgi:urease accessory protein